MNITKEKKKFQIFKTNNITESTQVSINKNKNSVGINEYYKQIESYAQQIRSTDNLSEIINILDGVLIETKHLYFSNEVINAREKVHRTEKDIKALKNELEALEELVHTDATGALNRVGLDASLLREAARADRHNDLLCLVLINLDDFKLFNDTYGHHAGDRVLSYLVNITKRSLRPSDIVGRLNGEEFVILLPNTTIELAALVTKRLQDNLVDKCLLQADQSIPITFSAGVVARTRYEHQSSVIDRADRALYMAKTGGKNQIVIAD